MGVARLCSADDEDYPRSDVCTAALRPTAMPPLSLIVIAFAAIVLDSTTAYIAWAHTDTCSIQIAKLEALLDQSMGKPVAKPTLPQSFGAQLHRQPTPESVRRAEQNAQFRLRSILAHAKSLDEDGRTSDCFQSIAYAKRVLGTN